MGVRRIEAGILDYGTDIEPNMTPYAAGLGTYVDLSKPGFYRPVGVRNSR